MAKRVVDGCVFVLREQANMLQHGRVGQRSPYILANQAVVERAVLGRFVPLDLFVEPVALLPEFGHNCIPFCICQNSFNEVKSGRKAGIKKLPPLPEQTLKGRECMDWK